MRRRNRPIVNNQSINQSINQSLYIILKFSVPDAYNTDQCHAVEDWPTKDERLGTNQKHLLEKLTISVCLPVCLSACLPVCLSVCLLLCSALTPILVIDISVSVSVSDT